jgi:hypothetical protein
VPMQSPKVIVVSVVGVALALLLSQHTVQYQFAVRMGLPQVGVFLAACAGGPIWGLAAGIVGGLGFYYGGLGTTWLYVLASMGLASGLLAYKMRAATASILSWLTIGLIASYAIYTRSGQPAQALYAWLTTASYEAVASAVIAEVALMLLGISRVRKKKEAVKEKAAAVSEAQTEIGL